MRKRRESRINRILDMPREVSSKEPKITILGFEKVLIENYKGILEYEEFFVRINTFTGIININGFGLKLDDMTSDDVTVKGRIEGIDFERAEE